MKLALLEAELFHVRELAKLAGTRQLSQPLFLVFNVALQLSQFTVLLLICTELAFPFLHLTLDALLVSIHLMDLLLLALSNLLSPLRVTPVQLLQKVLFRLGQRLFRSSKVLVHGLNNAIGFIQGLIECLLFGHQFDTIGLDARQLVFHLSTEIIVEKLNLREKCIYDAIILTAA